MIVIGVDAGGTFTDFIAFDGRSVRTHKLFSSKRDPAGALRQGLRELGLSGTIIHGTTIATNAFLERRGAKVALVTTKGFEELIDIGRQTRSRLYALDWEKPAPLVSKRIGVDERVGPRGEVIRPMKRMPVVKAESVAVCFLHSYANPRHEAKAARELRRRGLEVSVSSELVPEYREYERFATTVLNAYVGPVMKRYLGKLDKDVRIMSSAGGQMSSSDAAKRPVHTLLSGPAGGAIATEAVCKASGVKKAIAIDIGGTSADVSLYDGALRVTKEGTLGGFPLRVPILEIHTVGAGGGSIARIDAGGALRVGPESAGAEPGPACYGRGGTQPTVTDANVVLGRIDPGLFFGGKLKLDVKAAARALSTLGSPRQVAAAVLDVVDANMERALRTVSVERGYDPEEFTLIPFGGAGPLHACSLAERLKIGSILVPRWPGLFSALGMVLADEVHEQSRTVLGRDVKQAFREMKMPGKLEYFVDARYRGQSYEIRTPYGGDFHALHKQRYGFSREDENPEIVNAIVRSTISRRKPTFERVPRGPSIGVRSVYRRHQMGAGSKVKGPCLVMEDNATTYIAAGWRCTVDAIGNLRLWR